MKVFIIIKQVFIWKDSAAGLPAREHAFSVIFWGGRGNHSECLPRPDSNSAHLPKISRDKARTETMTMELTELTNPCQI